MRTRRIAKSDFSGIAHRTAQIISSVLKSRHSSRHGLQKAHRITDLHRVGFKNLLIGLFLIGCLPGDFRGKTAL